MNGHCLEIIPNGLFLMDKTLETYIYEFGINKWQSVSSKYPCDNMSQTKVLCKAFEDEFIIVPSIKNGSSCTGMFNLMTKSWIQMEMDDRNALYDGFLERPPNSDKEETLLYFGGHKSKNDTVRDETIWKFNGQDREWEIYPIKLSANLTKHTTMMTLLHPDMCQ